jgi:hypothetical protein
MSSITWKAFAITCGLVLAPAGARADAVADWSRIALDSVLESRQSTTDALNTFATVHAAMFETLNFIEARYMPRDVVAQPSPTAISGDAAAIAAAHFVLVETYPDRRAMLDKALHASLEPIDGNPTMSATKVLGSSLAAIVWTVRMRTSTAPVRHAPAIDSPAWDRLTALVESKNLRPLERARIYALVSIAADEAMAAASRGRGGLPAGGAFPCEACAVQAAADTVLRLELGSAGLHPLPLVMLPGARAVLRVGFVPGTDDSIAAGKELGARIGGYVSHTYYKPREE